MVTDVGVQRVPVPGHLLGAVGPGDRAERAGNTGGGRGAGHRRPVRGTASVAARLARGGVRGERVHGQALGVGEHSHPAGLAGLQRRRATAGRGCRGARAGLGDDQQHQGHGRDHGDQGLCHGYPGQHPGQPLARAAAIGHDLRGHGEQAEHGERGHLDEPGDYPRGGTDLGEAEQADPDRQQVSGQGGQGEPGAKRGHHRVAGGQHRGGQDEPGDHLEQEQPADGRDVLESGQVQVKVDRRSRRQQPSPGDPEHGL